MSCVVWGRAEGGHQSSSCLQRVPLTTLLFTASSRMSNDCIFVSRCFCQLLSFLSASIFVCRIYTCQSYIYVSVVYTRHTTIHTIHAHTIRPQQAC